MSINWIEKEKKYYMFTVRRQPVVIDKAAGVHVWDVEGKEYLDFTAGWAVTNLGHCHPSVTNMIKKQSETLLQTSNQFYTKPQLLLAEILVEQSCLDKVFFCNSGAEAVEGACKLAKKYGKTEKNGAFEIITALNSFHGRTQATLAATGQPKYQETFKPLLPGFTHVPYNDFEAIKTATNKNTVAVMLEPIQGEGGVNIPDIDYLSRVKEWCVKHDLLFILDEVQTGLGRIGTLFGYQYFNVEPDVITLGKALGNGVPIGAFLSKDRVMKLEPGDHGSTFGGNALATAAAFASTEYIVKNNISNHAKDIGKKLKLTLQQEIGNLNIVKEIRGVGLLLAIEFTDDISANLVQELNANGLLTNPVKPNAIRLMPPLIINEEDINKSVKIIKKTLLQEKY